MKNKRRLSTYYKMTQLLIEEHFNMFLFEDNEHSFTYCHKSYMSNNKGVLKVYFYMNDMNYLEMYSSFDSNNRKRYQSKKSFFMKAPIGYYLIGRVRKSIDEIKNQIGLETIKNLPLERKSEYNILKGRIQEDFKAFALEIIEKGCKSKEEFETKVLDYADMYYKQLIMYDEKYQVFNRQDIKHDVFEMAYFIVEVYE